MEAVTQIIFFLVESGEDTHFENHESKDSFEEFSDANVYLVIAICIISSIFLITLIAFTVIRWQKYRDEVNELKENYKICSNTGGSWLYSQQTQYRVCSNSHQGKNDLIMFAPNSSQTSSNEKQANLQEAVLNSSYKVRYYVL